MRGLKAKGEKWEEDGAEREGGEGLGGGCLPKDWGGAGRVRCAAGSNRERLEGD